MDDHDFGGYATKANLKCSDGRTITSDAFKHMDGQELPLVWQHRHDSVENVLGHAKLKHSKEGVYAYGYFNDTSAGINAKKLVEHGDITFLSIYANNLVEKNNQVLHGDMCEVSLVLKGANKGAKIDYVQIAHGDGDFEILPDEAVITTGEELQHGGKTYQEVYDNLDEDEKSLVEFMVKEALQTKPVEHSDAGKVEDDKKADDKSVDDKKETGTGDDPALKHKENDKMTRNVFENSKDDKGGSGGGALKTGGTLTHSQMTDLATKTFAEMVKGSTFKDAVKDVLEHADDYGITNIEMLFPEAQALDTKPEWITRRMEWVEGVLSGTRKLPFSRIKSLTADLTHEDARAKGYIKGTLKKEQFFAIARRDTTPKTIYKKQKLDRDDIVDITDFDVVGWLWVEMYFMLREEIARAILVGDGREIDDEDKIDETKIRPIAYDDVFYTDVLTVPANVDGSALIEAVLRGRNNYKGTAPTAYMTNGVMIDMLLSKDNLGRRYYNSKAELAAALNVQGIVEVEILDGAMRDGAEIQMIIVNMGDYAVGSTKGGEITKFDDFDIDYNQYKYLIETRLSGALTSPKRAQVVVRGAGTLANPTVPTFNTTTGVLTVPTVTGVTYKNQQTGATLAAGAQTPIAAGASVAVVATANTGYYFPHNFDADWTFTRDA